MNTNQNPNRRQGQNPNRRQGPPNRRPKPKNNNKPIIFILIVIIIAVIGIGGFLLLRSKGVIPGKTGTGGKRPSFTSSISYEDMLENIVKAKEEINDEVVGWITIPGTNINQSVTHFGSATAPIEGEDGGNEYYIYRDMQKVNHPGMTEHNWVETALFTHWRNNFDVYGSDESAILNKNYVIFGHNWTNYKVPPVIGDVEGNTMFAQLPSYTDVDFAKENPYIHFSTEEYHMVWKVFGVMYTEADWKASLGTDFNYIEPEPNEEQFKIMMKEFEERSLLTFDTGINKDDTILTLSTCTRAIDGAGGAQRFVVVARLLRNGESDTDPVSVTKNPNPKAPIFN